MGVESATSEMGPWKQSTHPTSLRLGMEYSHGGRMADLTWYSTEKADKTFATKAEVEALRKATEGRTPDVSTLATKEEVRRGDDSLSSRIEAVKSTADGALPKAEAVTTYATKEEALATERKLGERITAAAGAAATKSELSQYATSNAVADTYATKESLGAYLKAEDAASTYATKAALAQAQLAGGGQAAPDLSGFATKTEMRQADDALGAKIEGVKSTASAALPKAEAAATYATKSALEAVKGTIPTVPDTSRFVTSEAADGKYAKKTDLGQYVTTSVADGKYATQATLSDYLTTATAANTYSTKAQAAAMGDSIRNARAIADAALPKAEAAATYATKAELSQAQAGGRVDLSSYLTRDDAYSTFVQQQNLERELAQKASLEDVNTVTRRVDTLSKTITPFKPGERYYSPVTYFWPDYYEDGKPGKTSKWASILKFAGSLGIVILNRNSGNWDEFNVDFKKQAELALAAGAKRAVFYVKTQYLAATLPAGDPGRANVPDVDKYTEAYILSQIAKAKEQYGDVCQGVFLDEAINGWGDQAGRIPAYKSLIDKIRAQHGKEFLIVINSGSNISEDMCKLDFDVCMMFEKDASAFLVEDPGTPILPDHMKQYPSTRWWAVVHGVTSENYKSVFDKADKLGIAHLYITDGQLREDPQRGGQWEPVGNPYANPPSQHVLELVVPWLKGYLPLKLEVEELRTRPKVLSLGKREAIPAGTPAGTIIVRKDA
nr:MAG TPA: Spherulation-specific family 4 [Caudoviricetes sp.]